METMKKQREESKFSLGDSGVPDWMVAATAKKLQQKA